MKRMRKISALVCCGIVLGAGMSVFGASPATGRAISRCDQKIDDMEKAAAKQYAKGKLTADEYAKVQAEIAYHRQLWGC